MHCARSHSERSCYYCYFFFRSINCFLRLPRSVPRPRCVSFVRLFFHGGQFTKIIKTTRCPGGDDGGGGGVICHTGRTDSHCSSTRRGPSAQRPCPDGVVGRGHPSPRPHPFTPISSPVARCACPHAPIAFIPYTGRGVDFSALDRLLVRRNRIGLG